MDHDSPAGEFPLRIGPPERFASVTSLLRESSYDEATLLDLLGRPDLSGLMTLDAQAVDLDGVEPGLATLVRLFLLADPVRRADVEDGPLAASLDDLLALDLLRPGGPSEPGSRSDGYHATVLLYPVEGVWLASDRHRNPDGSAPAPRADIVFPGTAGPTQRFLRILPRRKVRDVLDVGTGTGVAALLLSRTAERVVASDVTERAVHFARFNARLNERENVEVVRSDVYAALEDLSFERIVSHPPFIPAPTDEKVFRDAGVTGESITRRIVEGLPRHLKAGGSLHCMCAGWNARDRPFEVRAREWLGEDAGDFDLVFARALDMSPEDLARRVAERAGMGLGAARLPEWRRELESRGFGLWVSGALVAKRRGGLVEPSGPLTLRRTFGAGTDEAAFDRALELGRWRQRIDTGGPPGTALATAQPHFAPGFRCQVTFSPGPGTLEATSAVAEVDAPFPEALRIEPWMMNVVARLDGRRTVSQSLTEAKGDGIVPDGFALDDLARLVADMVERGHLVLKDDGADSGLDPAPLAGFQA